LPRVLITGITGFLGKELKEYLFSYEIIGISRSSEISIDLTDRSQVDLFFKCNSFFDYVIHTSVAGGKRGVYDDYDVLLKNLLMFDNIISNKRHFGKMFNFCSGAAFGRSNNVVQEKEENIGKYWPTDYYGLSKNIIARKIKQLNYVYNLRLFGCFGRHEEFSRFIGSYIRQIKYGERPVIHQDKQMDFISAQDVSKIIEYYIENQDQDLPRDINLVYPEKLRILDIAKKIERITGSGILSLIQNPGMGNTYTGDGSKLQLLGIELDGLTKGIEDYVIK
jgi:GDP-L-fucose synthase